MTTSRDPRRDPRLLSRIVQPPGLPVPLTVTAGAAVRHSGPIQVQVTGLDDNWTNYLAAELEQKAIKLGPNRVSFRKDAVLDPKTSHLVVGRLRRTEKLLSAIASGRPNIVMADSILSSSLLDKAVILAADVGDRKCQEGRLQQSVFVPTRAERDGWAKSGGFFARDTVVILLADSETKAKVRRILEAGGATVLPRTINHLVDNFDSAVTMIVTEPKLFEDTGAGMMGHPRRYSQLADICQKRSVHLVSLAYIEVALTSAQTVSKKQFSVLRSEMIRYHQQIVSAVRSQPVHDRKRCGSPPLFTRGCSAGAAGHAAVVASPFAKPPAASSSRSKSAASSNGNRACDIVGSWIPASEYFNLTGVGGSLTNNNNNSCVLLEGGVGSIFRPDYDSADERGDDAMYSHLREISAEQDEAKNLMAVVEKERGEPFDLAMIPIPTAEPSSGNSRASQRGDWGSLTGHQQLEQRPTQSGDHARTVPALVTRQTADVVSGIGGGRHQGSFAYPPLPVPVPVTDQSSHQPFVLPSSPVPVQPPLPPEENVPPTTRGSNQEGPISFSLTGSVGSKRSATNKLPTFDELIVNSFAAVKKKKEASKERRTETSPRKEAGSSRHSWSLGTSENCAEVEEVTDRQSRVDKSSRSSSSSFVDKYFQTLDTADKSRDRDYDRSSRRDRDSGGSSSSRRRDRHEGSSRHDRHHDGSSRKYDRHDSSSRHERHLEGSRRRRSSKGDESPVKEKRRKDRRGSDVQLVDLCDSD